MLVEGRAQACQEYPIALCQAVCDGVAAQKQKDQPSARSMGLLDSEEMLEVVRAAHLGNECCASSLECPNDALHEPDPESGLNAE